jgi:predicted O-methyltransferase YrrM
MGYKLFRPHKNGHGIHSPFLFDYILNVLNKKEIPHQITGIIKLRRQLLKDRTVLDIKDLGAGSVKSGKTRRTIREITKHSSSTIKYGKLLYRIMEYFQPATILELGTCLGIGTAFLAAASPKSAIITLEGSDQLINRAKKNFEYLRINNVTTFQGNFNDLLPSVLNNNSGIDMVFIDGNHKGEATIEYFEACLQNMTIPGIIIFDDIRWSEDMFHSWNKIIKNEHVTLSIDLFQMGIIFLNPKLKKQHFQIYY